MQLNNEEIRRYSRHLILPEVGMAGQKKICSSSVLCIGAGGLGSPIAMYLAAAGVGKLGILDFDSVDFSNLQRQIIHGTSDVGRPKTQSAKETIESINHAKAAGLEGQFCQHRRTTPPERHVLEKVRAEVSCDRAVHVVKDRNEAGQKSCSEIL